MTDHEKEDVIDRAAYERAMAEHKRKAITYTQNEVEKILDDREDG